MRRVLISTVLLAAVAAVLPGLARAAVAPPVQWCGGMPATTDRADIVAGRQVHVIYAYPSDGSDRMPLLGSAIATELSAVDSWWRRQDYSRTPRFDLADFGCPGSMGDLDISDVKLPRDSSVYYASATRLDALRQDLGAAGFNNNYKKYLVYYDSPQALTFDYCGLAYEDPANGGLSSYASVFLAPNLQSDPYSAGCGDMTNPDFRGGYTALTAAHELLHSLGALDYWDTPGPPHQCPDSRGHACDDPRDIMSNGGASYWLDDTILDVNHDDYYAHSGTWWDVQDSKWLKHLDQPTYALTVQEGAGVATVASTEPGVACIPGAPCVSTWDAGTIVELTAAPANGFTRVVWGGACATAAVGQTCTVTMGADTTVTASYLAPVSGGPFAATYLRHPARVRAALRLSRPPLPNEATLECRGTSGLKLLSHAIVGGLAVCVWSVPKRLAGKRVGGRVSVGLSDSNPVTRAFVVKLPRKL